MTEFQGHHANSGGREKEEERGEGKERAMTEDLMLFLGLLRRILALIPGTPCRSGLLQIRLPAPSRSNFSRQQAGQLLAIGTDVF